MTKTRPDKHSGPLHVILERNKLVNKKKIKTLIPNYMLFNQKEFVILLIMIMIIIYYYHY
jgi:hypothetical protein